MQWTEVTIQTSHEASEAVSHILHEAGASGVVVEDSADFTKEREQVFGEIYAFEADQFPKEGVILKAYLPVVSTIETTLQTVSQAINKLPDFGLSIGDFQFATKIVEEEDWANAWKQYYHPVKISDRFTIVPSWEQYERKSSEEIVIELDPGMAFGTGTHATTVLSLQALEKYVQPGDEVVDVGTGSGVLAIGAAKLGAYSVHALDLDLVAVEAARENVRMNDVESVVRVTDGNLLLAVTGQPRIIVANILADIIMSFSEAAASLLPKEGLFIVSGIIGAKKAEVIDNLRRVGFDLIEETEQEDWVALVGKKRE